MAQIVLRLILNAIVLLLITQIVPGFQVDGLYTAIIVALFIGLLNAFIKPILLILTLPITVLTLGLFAFVLNILLFWLVSTFVKGFSIHTLSAAVIGWLLYTVAGVAVNMLLQQ